jgi:PAS domain S-box-containing protein
MASKNAAKGQMNSIVVPPPSLSRQGELFRAALFSMVDAVITTDTQLRVTFMNPTARALTGWDEVEPIGKPLADIFNIVNEKTRHLLESPATKALRDGKIVGPTNHTLLLARDGSETHIDDSAAPMRDADGGITGVVMVFHDITERRAAEKRMEVSEIRYRRLFEAAHDGILILDVEHFKITDVNPFMLRFLDHPREYFKGKELWEIGMFEDRAASETAMRKLNDTGSVRFENLPLQHLDGRQLPVEVVANIYQEDRDKVIQCNIRDISERRHFEAEGQAHLIKEQSLRIDAEAANRSKDMFLATLSHELRTPLNAIVGWVSILREADCNGEDLREGLDVIDRNTKAQVKLIEDVLDVSRIVSGKLRLEIRPCELVKAISAAIEVVQASASAKNITIHTDFDLSANEITCDPSRIQQVVWNLIANAVKFTANGGSINVSLRRSRSMARIQVIDTGRGIEPDFLPLVFDRFRQADSTTRRKFGGLGLGLSIVKQLMELHGGTVKAESAGAGTGATFTIEIPIRALIADAPDDEPPSPGVISVVGTFPEVRLDGLRILIVDDEVDSRRAVFKVLQSAGAVVTAASSVTEAMKMIVRTPPDILVSDIGMPDEDGYDLIRKVRAAGHGGRALPAVALTAFAHKEDQRRALLSGFQVHVSKPVDPHDLVAVIGSLAGRTGTM